MQMLMGPIEIGGIIWIFSCVQGCWCFPCQFGTPWRKWVAWVIARLAVPTGRASLTWLAHWQGEQTSHTGHTDLVSLYSPCVFVFLSGRLQMDVLVMGGRSRMGGHRGGPLSRKACLYLLTRQ